MSGKIFVMNVVAFEGTKSYHYYSGMTKRGVFKVCQNSQKCSAGSNPLPPKYQREVLTVPR